jgi:hypothetical protein
MAFVIFFSIVLTIYFLVNLYIYKHLLHFNLIGLQNVLFKIAFFTIVFAYPLGRVLERALPSLLSDLLVKMGSIWLGAMLYFTLFFLLIDLFRLISWVFSSPNILGFTVSKLLSSRVTFGIIGFVAINIVAGYINALLPKVNRLSINTTKSISGYKTLRVAMASDIHLGTVISNGRLSRFVEMMNSQKPDIILLAGDIFDEDIGPVIKRDMGSLISKLKAPLGIYAVTGNHEYIGGVEPAVNYLTQHGVTVIRDSVISPQNLFNIVGREDRQSKIMGGYSRKSITELASQIDKSKFTFLLDHQPYNLNEAVENGIDFQLSGHTHHGQLWPFNFITQAIFEVSRGYKKIEQTHFFVSTGFGSWGPPIRIGNRPEIVVFEIVTSEKP